MIEFALFAIVTLLSIVGVSLVRSWAWSSRVLDLPNHRSSHSRPIPRGGGLIVAVLVLGTSVVLILQARASATALLGFAVGGLAIAAVGWLDDLRSLTSRVRFGVHGFAAILLIISAGFWNTVSLPFFGEVALGYLGVVISFLWLVGLTNAYNFMDGIDGIAGGQAVVAGLGWAVLGLAVDLPLVTTLGLVTAGSSLGFLKHNWPKASIFLGDVGSGFLGFTFAALALIGAASDTRLAFAGVLLVWPFIFDAAFTFVCRARRGEDVFSAHRSHLYQRLVIAGHSHRFVSSLYIALAAIGWALSMSWTLDERIGGLLSVTSIPILAVLLWRYVRLQEQRTTGVAQQAQPQA